MENKKNTNKFQGQFNYGSIRGNIYIFSTDIWMVGSLPIHGDGENWVMYDLRTAVDSNLSLSKAWGASTNDMYFVGRNGSIASYHNGQWSRVESGTDLPLTDIYANNQDEIYAAG